MSCAVPGRWNSWNWNVLVGLRLGIRRAKGGSGQRLAKLKVLFNDNRADIL